MIRLAISRKPGSHAIPAHLTTLSVSWLNNQFKAVAVNRGVVEGTWEHPGEADGVGNFERFLHEAVQQTGYRGQTVSLVLAHPRLVQQLMEVPPIKGAQRILLHLFPRLLVNQLIQGCKRNGLHLAAVIPPSAVLQQQLTQLQLQKAGAALLAAETGGSTTLVMGHADGQILLARTLPGNWNQDTERLAVDLNRTILFVHQQQEVATNHGVWLFGPGASEQ